MATVPGAANRTLYLEYIAQNSVATPGVTLKLEHTNNIAGCN